MERQFIPFDQLLEKFGTEKEKVFFAKVEEMKDLLDHDDICIKQAKIVTRYLNTDTKTGEVWIPNYNDGSRKYMASAGIEASDEQPAGVGFSDSTYDGWFSFTVVGVRLCFKSSDDAMYAVDAYPEIYKGWWLPHLFETK